MRIGVSTSVIQRGKTGIAQYLFALLRAFMPHAREHEFTLFVLEEDVPLFDFAVEAMQIVSVSERFRPPVKNIIWHQTQLPSLIRQRQIDVLHVPSYRRLIWRRPCALIATIHDLAPFQIANKYDWKRMFYGRVIARCLAKRQDHIIAISQNTARDVKRWFGIADDQISTIHNGLDHQRFFPAICESARGAAAQKFGLSQPFFLYVARLEHPAKNHVRLITAFNQFKTATGAKWNLVFGGSDWNGAEKIHAAARASPFAADIRILGFVDDRDLPGLYRAAEVFVYPSLYEGFGLPPLEAMACGCPVISSDCGSLGEIAVGAAAIVDPEDTDSMAQQLSLLSSDAGLRNRLRALGLEQARRFDWQVTASRTLEVYQHAATG